MDRQKRVCNRIQKSLMLRFSNCHKKFIQPLILYCFWTFSLGFRGGVRVSVRRRSTAFEEVPRPYSTMFASFGRGPVGLAGACVLARAPFIMLTEYQIQHAPPPQRDGRTICRKNIRSASIGGAEVAIRGS